MFLKFVVVFDRERSPAFCFRVAARGLGFRKYACTSCVHSPLIGFRGILRPLEERRMAKRRGSLEDKNPLHIETALQPDELHLFQLGFRDR